MRTLLLSLLATTVLLGPAKADDFDLEGTFSNDNYGGRFRLSGLVQITNGVATRADIIAYAPSNNFPGAFYFCYNSGPPCREQFEQFFGTGTAGTIDITACIVCGLNDTTFETFLDIHYSPFGSGFQIDSGSLTTIFLDPDNPDGFIDDVFYFGTGLTGTICPPVAAGCAGQVSSVPGPIAGAGLPSLMILASGGLLGLWRRRQRAA